MRALTAVLIATLWSALHTVNAENNTEPIKNILDCTTNLGPVKCFNALAAYRAERAIKTPNTKYNLIEDIEQFRWNKYRNSTDDQLYSQLCDGTEKLLGRQSLSLTMVPGYRFELLSKGNGTIDLDVYKNDETGSGRSSIKKAKKTFFKILPVLLIPGLIMSAVLPFILPALKLMTVGVGILNNMALTGAIFTLLRNNAFNDKYHHKVIYVNDGYKNEKHAHFKHAHHSVDYDANYAESVPVEYSVDSENIGDHLEENVEEDFPLQSGWIDEIPGPEHVYKGWKRKSKT